MDWKAQGRPPTGYGGSLAGQQGQQASPGQGLRALALPKCGQPGWHGQFERRVPGSLVRAVSPSTRAILGSQRIPGVNQPPSQAAAPAAQPATPPDHLGIRLSRLDEWYLREQYALIVDSLYARRKRLSPRSRNTSC